MLDLNVTVTGMLSMLQRLIGENIDLVWAPGPELWTVCVDPSQIDQVLVNLLVNARDAIVGQGTITIRTANAGLDETDAAQLPGARPGDFVVLSVDDTGRGMDQETLAHAFDPFYTTKDVGEGTGLGLATVYGIVSQNDGFIRVHSEPGAGAGFELYFPRCAYRSAPESAPESPAPAGAEVGRGLETVLVVEDEPTILNLCLRQLRILGYNVLGASSPQEALRIAADHPGPLDLVITDVIMPGMNGREFVTTLLQTRPHLKCLYMSGYTADVITCQGVLDPDVHFLQKPFTQAELAAGVREALKN